MRCAVHGWLLQRPSNRWSVVHVSVQWDNVFVDTTSWMHRCGTNTSILTNCQERQPVQAATRAMRTSGMKGRRRCACFWTEGDILFAVCPQGEFQVAGIQTSCVACPETTTTEAGVPASIIGDCHCGGGYGNHNSNGDLVASSMTHDSERCTPCPVNTFRSYDTFITQMVSKFIQVCVCYL